MVLWQFGCRFSRSIIILTPFNFSPTFVTISIIQLVDLAFQDNWWTIQTLPLQRLKQILTIPKQRHYHMFVEVYCNTPCPLWPKIKTFYAGILELKLTRCYSFINWQKCIHIQDLRLFLNESRLNYLQNDGWRDPWRLTVHFLENKQNRQNWRVKH